MMQQLKAKLKKQGGFTLIEMLIVVAIIAILIAISIPLVNGALEKARDSTDQANERAAKAITLLVFMGVTEDKITGGTTYKPGEAIPFGTGGATKVYYDAKTGSLTTTMPAGYGQCTGAATCYTKDSTDTTTMKCTHVGKVIEVTIDANGIFTPKWVSTTP